MERGKKESERRSGDDRRSGDERRAAKKPLTADSRTGSERRSGERRNVEALRQILGGRLLADAAIDTPVTYSRDEAAKIRAQVAQGTDPVICPRCNTALKRGPRITRKREAIQELVCETCRRCVMVKPPN